MARKKVISAYRLYLYMLNATVEKIHYSFVYQRKKWWKKLSQLFCWWWFGLVLSFASSFLCTKTRRKSYLLRHIIFLFHSFSFARRRENPMAKDRLRQLNIHLFIYIYFFLRRWRISIRLVQPWSHVIWWWIQWKYRKNVCKAIVSSLLKIFFGACIGRKRTQYQLDNPDFFMLIWM